MARAVGSSALLLALPIHAVKSIVSVSAQLAYLPPEPFDTKFTSWFVNSTVTSDPGVNDLLSSARDVPFISFDPEFDAFLGDDAQITLVDSRDTKFAGEAGIWISERNEVWYTSWINDGPTHVEIFLDPNSTTVRDLTSSRPLRNPNGGYYHQGLVYFACL